VDDVIPVADFPWASAVVMVTAVAGVTVAVVVLTVVDVPGAPAVTKVSAVAAITTAVDVLPAPVVFNISSVCAVIGVLAVVGVPAVDGVPTVEHIFLLCCFHCSCVPAVGVP
jgi:hypothetical protein